MSNIKIPSGWRRLEIGEEILQTDLWLPRWLSKCGSFILSDWSTPNSASGERLAADHAPHIRKVETSINTGKSGEDTKGRGDEVDTPSLEVRFPSLEDTRVHVPLGYILTKSRGRVVPGELYCTLRDNGSLRGSVVLSDWDPCGENHKKVSGFHYIVKAKDKPSDKPVLKEKEISKAEPKGVEPVKEKKEMATTTSPSGFFATLKASALVAGKTAASTTLAEKITELVLGHLPKKVQAMCRLVPRPVLVFAVSTAVYGAACRFDIPGREKVRDVSKYAVDGSMFEAMRLVMGLLDPLFKAIREMVPDDLKQLMNEASLETPPKN